MKIGWKNYDIEITDQELYDCDIKLYGQCLNHEAIIRITNIYGTDQMSATLIHELLHAFCFMYGLGLEENQVQALGNALYIFILDNGIDIKNIFWR